jgi:hypothetical protein
LLPDGPGIGKDDRATLEQQAVELEQQAAQLKARAAA